MLNPTKQASPKALSSRFKPKVENLTAFQRIALI